MLNKKLSLLSRHIEFSNKFPTHMTTSACHTHTYMTTKYARFNIKIIVYRFILSAHMHLLTDLILLGVCMCADAQIPMHFSCACMRVTLLRMSLNSACTEGSSSSEQVWRHPPSVAVALLVLCVCNAFALPTWHHLQWYVCE